MKVDIGDFPCAGEGERKIFVQIDKYDTWNDDETLSLIILPFLKRFKEEKHGWPMTEESDAPQFPDDPDLPEHERGFNQTRWNWIVDEMIWAFEQNIDPDNDEIFWRDTGVPGKSKLEFDREGWLEHDVRIKNGLRLFGTYFRSLWI